MARYLFLFIGLLFVTISCEEDYVSVKTGKLEFAFSTDLSASGGRIKDNISSLLVSIEDENGNVIHERKKIELYEFSGEYLSEPIALSSGNFKLTEFIVLDPNDVVVYATPLEGSPLAYLVDDPLPIAFSISKDNTTKVTPQVIKIEGYTSSDFGYTTFGFDVVDTFTFSAAVFAYDPVTENFELTSAHMKITSDADTLYNRVLPDSTASIRVEDGFQDYSITVTKDGFGNYEKSFTREELIEFVWGRPLIITLLTESLDSGLVAYYPFNGNADDQSGNGFDGIVHGASLTTDRDTIPNTAYRFDGVDDYIQVPHNDALNLQSDFTISLWTEVSSSQEAEGGINDILRKWNGNAEGYPFSISYLNPLADDATEDKILFARYDSQTCHNVLETHSPTIANDTFIHVAMIKEGDKIKTYLNNQLVAEVTDPMSCSTANTADVTIGCRGNLVRFFKGKIDDLRIYNRSLSDSEIGQLASE